MEVTEIGLGTWSLGGAYGHVEPDEAREVIRRAFELGINFFDTADIYGRGKSETFIGEVLSDVRDKVIIATKVGWDFYHGEKVKHNFDPDYIKFAIEQSLKRLRTDYVDIYQLHNPEIEVLKDDRVIDVLESLKAQGVIRFWGVSVSHSEDARVAMERGAQTLQLVYNILDREHGGFAIPEAHKRGIGIIVRTPLAYGFLTGKYSTESKFSETDFRRNFDRKRMKRYVIVADKLKNAFKDSGFTLAQIAIRFVLSNPLISTVIPGAKSVKQLEENVKAAEAAPLSQNELKLIDSIYSDVMKETEV